MAKKILVALAGLAAVLVAALVALAWPAYRGDIDGERQRVSSGSEVAQTACGPIEYAVLGEGPAVLLVHGAGGGYDQMLDTGRELAKSGFRVVAMSRFGYLRTPLPADASPAAQADAHACLLDALKIDRAAVVGASAGAPSSMQFALRHPKRCTALVLLVPLAWAPEAERSTQRRMSPAFWLVFPTLKSDFLFWLAMKTAPALVEKTVLGTPPEAVAAADARERQRIARMMRIILPVSLRQQGLSNEGRIATSLERYPLERIEAPTLLLSAADDLYGTYASARYTSTQIRGARFVGYPSGGHMFAGHDRDVMNEITRFLREHP
jgi:2-hydroxy-6-oxonona-2,4-dienedioate hydrolase